MTTRTCDTCLVAKAPVEQHFPKKGRGYRWTCNVCMPVKPAPKPKKPANDPLNEIVRLLKSPVCRRCGARGAERGNPSLCGDCR